jgi:hypothetical protein
VKNSCVLSFLHWVVMAVWSMLLFLRSKKNWL